MTRFQAIQGKDFYWYPNQKMLAINREQVDSNTKRQYLIAYTDNLIDAMYDLTPSAFKVSCTTDATAVARLL